MTARQPRGRAWRVRSELYERDLAVLRSLYHLRLLSPRHLQRLHVVDGAVSARTRRAQLLLKRLHDLGLVVRLSRVVGGVRAGSAGYIYGLSGLGQAVLDVNSPYGRRRRRTWETKPYFQDHMLAVAELYVGLAEVERRSNAELLTFDGEPRCWRHFTGSGGELVVLKPDAYVRVGIGDLERSAFIEVELSPKSDPTIRQRCQRYIAYWRSATEQRRRGVFPIVLWLVPDEQRYCQLTGVVRKLPAETQALFEVGLAGKGPQLLTSVEAAA